MGRDFINNLKFFISDNPLKSLVFVGLFFRILAVIFSKGFGMHDDHFLVIEAAQSWVDGTDYSRWLPSGGAVEPSGHSLFYPSLHYLLFSFLKWIGVTDPQSKMFIVRLLHTLWSLIIIIGGYHITNKLSDKKTAFYVGFMLSLLFYMPWLSVRNLVEFVCIPFIMIGIWISVSNSFRSRRVLFYAGLLFGLSMSVRFQLLFFTMGFFLALLLMKKFRTSFYFALGCLLSFGMVQGLIDYYIWKKPFAEVIAYFSYNLSNPFTYITHPWYQYVIILLGFLIPPISILLFFGFFSGVRKRLFIFLPVFLFLLFHSIFPNKQERFIIPIIPFFIIAGTIGWNEILQRSSKTLKKITNISIVIFLILNTLFLPVLSTMYSKKSRVESMEYLSRFPEIKQIIMEDRDADYTLLPPFFYLEQWNVIVYERSKSTPIDSIKSWLPDGSGRAARFILFHGDYDLETRVSEFTKLYPKLVYETTITPGYVDEWLYKLNPLNRNQTIYIYRNAEYYSKY